MPRPLGILLIGAMACGQSGESPAPSPPPKPASTSSTSSTASTAPASAPLDAAPPADAAPAVDAMAFALFDHLAVRQVKSVEKPPTLAPPADLAAAPKLVVTPSPEAQIKTLELPPWLQHSINKLPILAFHANADGTAVAATVRRIALIDASHKPEIGLDFDGFHGPSVSLDGGDHVFDNLSFQISDVVRDGSIVIAVVTDPVGVSGPDGFFLVAIDATTASFAWRSEPGSVRAHVMMAKGLVIASRGHQVVALRADTGKVVATAPTHKGPYEFIASAHGILGNPFDETDGRIEVDVQ